ncbi:CRISPR-associated endoribonuclease Cas6 [Candidatus Bathyarchaeota archaeon]|nr:CRISPR-associated endoribonuclease Cas6 [Candidatus Bathyarchaeota archaeon]
MPVEVGLELYGERPVTLPSYTGYVSRGLLLHIFKTVDPRLSASMHEADKPKPYSVTPLRFKAREKLKEGYLMDPAYPCRVCFRFLQDGLMEKLLKYFQGRGEILLFEEPFHVASMRLRSTSYRELWESGGDHGESFKLYFMTPTYLSASGTEYHYLFPDHERIFPNLLRIWNHFSDDERFTGEELEEYKEWLHRNMGVSQHRLETRMAYMREKKATGFTGWAVYEMKKRDRWSRVTATLARYAEYSNIGGNRTGGFGVTRYWSGRGAKPGLDST